jgi:hypothetical protein
MAERDLLRVFQDMGPEDVREQVVIAVPLALAI